MAAKSPPVDETEAPGGSASGQISTHQTPKASEYETGATGGTIPASVLFGSTSGTVGDTRIGDSPSDDEDTDEDDSNTTAQFAPIAASPSAPKRPNGLHRSSTGEMTQEDLMRVLSKRRTNASGASDAQYQEEQAEIERLMSRMFGRGRQNNSEEEKTRHVGVVFKNLTIKGVGLGAAIQPTVGDIFLGLPRKIGSLFRRNKKIGGGPPIRTIINNFSGVIRPGEMVFVLVRPGSACSSFLKVLGNQRTGFKRVDGEVT